ncbi:MAG: hypothetical protein IT371_23275 [Deltaproteobacteria bacterium]|nr:hypothetical protein [Deltaproteobacteria bacterium]
MHVDPDFLPLIVGFSPDALERQEGAIYGLWGDLRLAYFNGSYERFAAANEGRRMLDAWPLGRSVLDAVAEPLVSFYRELFGQTLVSGQPRSHEYECPSPTLRRTFRMDVYPVTRKEGLLVVNSLLVEAPHAGDGEPAGPRETYRTADGLIVQCAHCRRTRLGRNDDVWHWVPAFVRTPPEETSHGLCYPCFAHHYPEPEEGDA